MTISRRIYYEYPVYHITSRGNNRQPILAGQADKETFLESLSRYKLRYAFKIYAFVLMDNHFHLIIETHPLHNISKVMQSILLSYSNKFRRKYQYVGHVWQGRFISRVIRSERQLINNIKYIHDNPVRANMFQDGAEYIWSSAAFYQGISNPNIEGKIYIDRFGDIITNISKEHVVQVLHSVLPAHRQHLIPVNEKALIRGKELARETASEMVR